MLVVTRRCKVSRCCYFKQPFLNPYYQCPVEDPEKLVPYNSGQLCREHKRAHALGKLPGGAIFTPKELNGDGSVKLWRLEQVGNTPPRVDLGGE